MQYSVSYFSNGQISAESYRCMPLSVGGGGMVFYPIYYCPGGEIPQMGVCAGVTPTLNPTPNPEKNFPPDRATCPSTDQGNPINAATGLKHQTEVDYDIAQGLAFRRNYTSVGADVNSPLAGPFGGVGWRLDWHRTVVGNGLVAKLIRGKGTIRTYTLVAGVWASDADFTATLTRNQNASSQLIGWTYVVDDGSIEQYNAAGKLISITDLAGRTTTLSYSDGTALAPNGGVVLDSTGAPTAATLGKGLLIRITDMQQRSLRLEYDAKLRVLKMTDPLGGVYRYGYDAVDNLVSVSYPDGSSKQYRYENLVYTHALTAIVDEKGNRFAGWVYDELGRATSSEHIDGVERVTLTYNADGTTSATNPLGITRTQNFLVRQGVAKSGGFLQPGGSGCAAAASSFAYDAVGNTTSMDDFQGMRTCYAYDAKNQETTRIEGLANTVDCATVLPANATLPATSRRISTTWHPDWRLAKIVTALGSITTTVHHGQPDPFNANAVANCTSAAVLPNGKVLPLVCKQVVQATLSNGDMDTSVANAVSQFTYDAAGRTLTSKDALNRTTSYTYYADTAFTGVDPTMVGHTLGDRQSITDPAGFSTTLDAYDKMGRVLQSTDPKGVVTNVSYTPRGWVSSVTTTAPGQTGRVTTYSYDAVGQLTGVASPDGTTVSYSYDAAHRLTGAMDARGNSVTYTLDNSGNKVGEQIKDPTGVLQRSIARSFDALNRVQQVTGAR
jgi:YD repeat-containing protein